MNRTHIGLGIFVLGTLALLIWLAQSIGALGGASGVRYEVRLEHAAGLVANNAVKIAGVEVGRIEKIGVDHDIAVLSLRVDPDVVLHTDAVAIVRAKSLLGEKYLQLAPGERESPVLEADGVISNVETHFEVDQVLNALQPLLGGEDSIAGVLGPLAERLGDMMDSIDGKDGKPPIITRAEIDQIIDDVKTTSATVRRIATENEEDIRAIVKNTRELTDDPRVDRLLARADDMSATLDERLPQLLDRTESALAKLEEVAKIVDDDRAKKIGRIIDDATVAMASLKTLSKDLEGLSKSVEPLVADLAKLARRAMALDGATIRQFLQKEGMKVYFGSKREADKVLGGVE
ncbi:MlaD family protein [Paraliomyxa miuraensis]|uniref:MlaD family protein n=1 Tax=Paraliomyxa miuraensis TaxID=376150 RepID=UPI00225562DB|nr:MlaD family protein [Paraliomyxa miuraensis]MCX4246437.1 MlaD family protein [Paraliomyxa miuraensis]